MKLDYAQALKQIATAKGAWVCHGDEPLLQQNLLAKFHHKWQTQQIERQRIDVHSVNDWKNVFAALDNLSLFANQLAIEVHTSIKPDAAALKLLSNFLAHPEDNFLLIVLPKQDSQSLKSQFFQMITANGCLVSLAAATLTQQRTILQLEAEHIGVNLTDDAWQWLLFHHENNLLAARNTLMVTADYYPDAKILDTAQFIDSVQDQSRFSSFDLSDACLNGNLQQAKKILDFLLQSGEAASLIFWILQKDMRLLLQLFEQPHHPERLGIWSSKVSQYQQVLRRITPQQLIHWSALLLRTDQAIKGISQDNPEDLMLQLVCALCGQPIFLADDTIHLQTGGN